MNKLYNKIVLFTTHFRFKVPKYRIAKPIIKSMPKRGIFVFGSNMNGAHNGGAALYAKQKFGAQQGVATGEQGRSFAIPTLDEEFERLPLDFIQAHVDFMIANAKVKPDNLYFVSAIGCGIAGFTVEEIAPMFKDAVGVKNIKLPEEFWEILV